MKITLEKKILSGFIACSLILFTVAVFSFRNSEKLLETNQWINHTHDVLYEFEQILVNAVDIETGIRGYVITGNDKFLGSFENGREKIIVHINSIKELTHDNAVQQEGIEKIRGLVITYIAYMRVNIDLRKSGEMEKVRDRVSTSVGKEMLDEIRFTIDNAKKVEQELLINRKKLSDEDSRNFTLIFIALLAVITLVLIVVYIIIMSNLKALKRAESETANKNWSLVGSGELVKGMQGNKLLPELLQSIINHLAVYLNAQVGALYITHKDGASLKLMSTYAISKNKKEFLVVNFGEGLAGQSAAERRTIEMTNVPAGYFDINTSFGSVLPKNIIAVPVLFEATVTGVIELGSICDFSDLQKQYLELVIDSIAIAITSAQARETTVELLEETQRQAEELGAQQEELKQSNEELYAKTDLLERSELELKNQQEELRQSNEELEEKANMLENQNDKLEIAKTEIESKAREIEITSKYKSEFLSNMSHELRTPLNSILILSQLLSENRNNVLGKKEIEFASNIHGSGTDLLNLINEILDLSKVEAGKIQLDINEVPIQSIITNISSLFSEIAKSKSIEFSVHSSERLPVILLTDKQRVEQILKNLLSNAFKFTEPGGKISLTINTSVPKKNDRADHANDKIVFAITDSGIGIPTDKQSIVFEAFQQADGSTKRKYGGTGLGLSISRELAHVLGGEILLESEEGRGSTFSMVLPVQFDSSLVKPTAKQVEIKVKEPVKKKVLARLNGEAPIIDDRGNILDTDRVILIIEDEEKFAKLLLDFVRERNFKGIIAQQGNTGLSYARHYRPHAIMLDIELPVMDGMTVLKHIKNDPDLRHTPVQIISAFERKKEGLELGAFDFITKPVTIIDLQTVFDKLEEFKKKDFKKLLIIEDNENQNKAIQELIGDQDVKCFAAYKGVEAFERLRQETFDCLIIDLGLPDMTGFELMEKIKGEPGMNRIPIIVYTGRDLKKEEISRLDKLASTVILKTADSKERLLDETILLLHREEYKLPKEKRNIIRKLHMADEILKNKKILLVDDDIRNIYSLTNALEEEGLICFAAENGQVALEMLRENSSINLVLMDIMMPEMDGYETTLEIRKSKIFGRLPIIALTAKAMKGDKEKCLAVGMSDYISKPVDLDQLLSLMRLYLFSS